MRKSARKRKDVIVYRTVKETIILTEKDVERKWIDIVNNLGRVASNLERKERYYYSRKGKAYEEKKWMARYERDPFSYLFEETPEEELNRLYYAMGRLPEDQRKLIDLIYFKGYSHKDVAAMEGVSRQAIEKRLKKIMEELRINF